VQRPEIKRTGVVCPACKERVAIVENMLPRVIVSVSGVWESVECGELGVPKH
jgi:hypothetical protein